MSKFKIVFVDVLLIPLLNTVKIVLDEIPEAMQNSVTLSYLELMYSFNLSSIVMMSTPLCVFSS